MQFLVMAHIVMSQVCNDPNCLGPAWFSARRILSWIGGLVPAHWKLGQMLLLHVHKKAALVHILK